LRKAWQLDTTNLFVRLKLAEVLDSLDRTDLALLVLSHAIARDSIMWEPFGARGLSFLRNGKLTAAAADFLAAKDRGAPPRELAWWASRILNAGDSATAKRLTEPPTDFR
jgi:hypothetical protein